LQKNIATQMNWQRRLNCWYNWHFSTNITYVTYVILDLRQLELMISSLMNGSGGEKIKFHLVTIACNAVTFKLNWKKDIVTTIFKLYLFWIQIKCKYT